MAKKNTWLDALKEKTRLAREAAKRWWLVKTAPTASGRTQARPAENLALKQSLSDPRLWKKWDFLKEEQFSVKRTAVEDTWTAQWPRWKFTRDNEWKLQFQQSPELAQKQAIQEESVRTRKRKEKEAELITTQKDPITWEDVRWQFDLDTQLFNVWDFNEKGEFIATWKQLETEASKKTTAQKKQAAMEKRRKEAREISSQKAAARSRFWWQVWVEDPGALASQRLIAWQLWILDVTSQQRLEDTQAEINLLQQKRRTAELEGDIRWAAIIAQEITKQRKDFFTQVDKKADEVIATLTGTETDDELFDIAEQFGIDGNLLKLKRDKLSEELTAKQATAKSATQKQARDFISSVTDNFAILAFDSNQMDALDTEAWYTPWTTARLAVLAKEAKDAKGEEQAEKQKKLEAETRKANAEAAKKEAETTVTETPKPIAEPTWVEATVKLLNWRSLTIDSSWAKSIEDINTQLSDEWWLKIWAQATSWFRSVSQQQKLYWLWRTEEQMIAVWAPAEFANPNEPIVTWADWIVNKSLHQSWLAIDLFPDRAYIESVKPIMNANWWFQDPDLVAKWDMGHFEYRWRQEFTPWQKFLMSNIDIANPTGTDLDALADAWITIAQAAEFRATNKVQLPPAKKKDLENILEEAKTLTVHPWFKWAVWAWIQKFFTPFFAEEEFVPWSDAQWFADKFLAFRDSLVLPNLDKLKWAMSDNDIKFIRNATTALNLSQSEKDFKDNLNSLVKKVGNIIAEWSTWNIPADVQVNLQIEDIDREIEKAKVDLIDSEIEQINIQMQSWDWSTVTE